MRPATGRGDTGNEAACNNWQFVLPGWHNHDLTLFKDIRMKGNQQFQFRWEIYNILNHAEAMTVNNTARFDTSGNQTNGALGAVTATLPERRMQGSLRFTF